MNELDSIDEQSREFIGWSTKELSDDNALISLIEEVTDGAREWLIRNRGILRDALLSKMIKGAVEHGPPIHPIEIVDQELEGEYLDLIGWTQIKRYNQRRLS